MATALREEHDRRKLAELSARFRPALTRYFLKRGVSIDDAEDLAQEVFVKLSRRDGLADFESADGYLFETAASVAIDHHRRSASRHASAHDAYDEREHAIADACPDRMFEARNELQLLVAGLNRLPERARNVFVLARLEKMRHAEIARRLGISVSSVEKQLVKALAQLADYTGRRP